MTTDIIIIGGGIVGSAAACFLARSGVAGNVTVIEPDPSYAKAATPAGAGGVRRLMSRPENIQMSQFSLDFYARFGDEITTDSGPADIQFRRQGYLFLTTAEGAKDLEFNFQTQRTEGVPCDLLDLAELQSRFPSVGTTNVALACHSPEDGWIDPFAALQGFRKDAERQGVTYLKDRVVGLETSSNGVQAAELETGAKLHAKHFINTAGAHAGDVARMSGAHLPVVPMCRVQHYWKCAEAMEPMPLIKDDTGAFFRPEGDGFVGGRPSSDIEPGFIWDIDRGYFANYFEDTVWPLVAAMVPKFERIKLQRSWPGHYGQNTLDGNMIIGPYSPGHDNIITACGFSGHGIMHAPAVGRALAELTLHGRYQTLDLERMGFERVVKNEPYAEIGIR